MILRTTFYHKTMHQVPASETARCKMVKVPKAAVACQPAAWRLSWHRCTRKKARFRESALLNVGISINAYPYHSMLLPIEYYKTRGHFPTSCSHTQEFRRFRIQIVLSRSSQDPNLFWHIGPSHMHLFKHLNKAVCDSKLQQGCLGETSSWLNCFLPWAIVFFFCHFAIQVLCISHPLFAPTTVVIVAFLCTKS